MNHSSPVSATSARIGLHRRFQLPLGVKHSAIRRDVGEGFGKVLHMILGLLSQALHIAGVALIPGLQHPHLCRGRIRGL